MQAVDELDEAGQVELIRRAARGDSEAFAALYDAHSEAIYNYALWLCNDPHHAQDIVQETFIRAHRGLARLRPPWKIRAWLRRLARNLYIDHTRRYRPTSPLDTDTHLRAAGPEPERELLRGELSGPVRTALQKLPRQQREALVLREVEGFNYTDIAETMGISLDSVKVNLHRARLAFRESYGLRLLVEDQLPRCDRLNEVLDAYHDGELSGDLEDEVRAHINDCSRCQQRKREMAALFILFRAQPRFKPPDGLRQRSLNRRPARQGHVWAVVGGSAVLAAIIAGWWFGWGPPDWAGGFGGGGEPPGPAGSGACGAPCATDDDCAEGYTCEIYRAGETVCWNASICGSVSPATSGTTSAPVCNLNGVCDAGEGADCADCGLCGNGVCDPGEHVYNCSVDCGEPPAPQEPTQPPLDCTKSCGNGTCDAVCGETPNSCPADCP